MPNRNVEGNYRYGYQGEYAEKDQETGLNAFQLRMYDSRINRWLTVDPMREFFSPYLSMGNNWVSKTDPTGGKTGKCPPDCDGTENLPLGATPLIGEDGFVNNNIAVELLDEVVVVAPGTGTGIQNNNFDFNNLSTGLFGASLINSTFESQINSFSKANFKDITIPKELTQLKGATKFAGRTINGISILSDTYQFANDDIGIGKYGYRVTGTGVSIYAAAAAGSGGVGLLVGGAFSFGESIYDAGVEIHQAKHNHPNPAVRNAEWTDFEFWNKRMKNIFSGAMPTW